MVTSSYQAALTVEIAFDSGFNTPAASRTWTDVSDYVEFEQGVTIVHGRQDERSNADANHLTLTLDNRDGRFTPEKTGGAYYPNVKLNRPIRVTTDPVDGPAQVEFLGFVDEWPVEWEDTDGYAKVTLSASSRLSRLGTQAKLKSIIETAILADSPMAYYTLAEPEGATQANDSSGQRANPLMVQGDSDVPVTFGSATGPGTDGLTAAQFATGQYLQAVIGSVISTGLTLECFFLAPSSPSPADFLTVRMGDTVVMRIGFNPSGLVRAITNTGTVTGGAYTFDDTHHLAATWTAGTLNLYLDGVLSSTGAPAGAPVTQPVVVTVGYGVPTATLSHIAVFGSALTGAQIAAHAEAGLAGYAGDLTSARLIRYAGYAGIEAASLVAETGQTTVQHLDTTDQVPVDLMRIMETTEGGVLFDDRDGTTVFHNRAHRLTLASSFTLDMAQQMVESDYKPKLDRTTLANDINGRDVTGKCTAHVFDEDSRTDHGVATADIETASEDDDEPLFQASWALYKYKEPKTRNPTLSVNCLAQVGKVPNCATVLAANVGDKITVSNRPSQDGSSSASFFVEGYTRLYGLETCVTTFNVSPSSPEDQTFIVGDSVRGVIGTNPIAL